MKKRVCTRMTSSVEPCSLGLFVQQRFSQGDIHISLAAWLILFCYTVLFFYLIPAWSIFFSWLLKAFLYSESSWRPMDTCEGVKSRKSLMAYMSGYPASMVFQAMYTL